MNIHVPAPPSRAVPNTYAPALAHLKRLRAQIDETLEAMVDTLDAIDAPQEGLEPDSDLEEQHDLKVDESEHEPDLGSLERIDQSMWSAGHEARDDRGVLLPVRNGTHRAAGRLTVRELFDRWLAARRALRQQGASSGEARRSASPSVREQVARIALVAAEARSVDDIVAHLGVVAILARGVEGLDAEIEADVITNTADIRTFAMRIVMDILVLGVDIVASPARAGEVAND